MPAIEELSDKIDRIERAQRNGSPQFLPYLISPLLLLIAGFFFIREIQRIDEAFKQLELEVRQVEAAQETISELFPAIMESAFVADRIKSKVLANYPSKTIPGTATAPESRQRRQQLLEKGPADAKGVAAAAEPIAAPAPAASNVRPEDKRYYIVVASAAPENGDNAVARAEELRQKGYRSAVRKTQSGALVVTLGPVPKDEAESVLAEALLRKDVNDDSFLSEGKSFTNEIYPK